MLFNARTELVPGNRPHQYIRGPSADGFLQRLSVLARGTHHNGHIPGGLIVAVGTFLVASLSRIHAHTSIPLILVN